MPCPDCRRNACDPSQPLFKAQAVNPTPDRFAEYQAVSNRREIPETIEDPILPLKITFESFSRRGRGATWGYTLDETLYGVDDEDHVIEALTFHQLLDIPINVTAALLQAYHVEAMSNMWLRLEVILEQGRLRNVRLGDHINPMLLC